MAVGLNSNRMLTTSLILINSQKILLPSSKNACFSIPFLFNFNYIFFLRVINLSGKPGNNLM